MMQMSRQKQKWTRRRERHTGHVRESQTSFRSYTAKELSRRNKAPGQASFKALKRYAKYLKGTERWCIWFPSGDQDKEAPRYIECYSDTNWANCRTSRRSTSCARSSACSVFTTPRLSTSSFSWRTRTFTDDMARARAGHPSMNRYG